MSMATTSLYWLLGPWTGLFLGILHTIMPCEDKIVFLFYAFGVSRDWKQSFRIVNLYGLGLFLSNMIIGSILSFVAGAIGIFGLNQTDRYIWNAASAVSLILGGTLMLIQLYRKTYSPHSDQLQEISESLPTLRRKKRTAFLLGMLAGIPPCIFELTVYTQAMLFSVQSTWGNGVWTVFFFGIGTWLGLFPLAILATMGGKVSKRIQQTSLFKLIVQQRHPENKDPNPNASESPKIQSEKAQQLSLTIKYSKVEIISAIALIVLGVILLVLAFLNIELIPLDPIPPTP